MDQKLLHSFKDALRRENLKLTPQRTKIFSAIAESHEHWEVDDLMYQFRKEGERISRATIYRTLDILVDYGFVRKVDFGEGRFRYEYAAGQNHHDHLICEECGEIVEFLDEKIEKQQETLCEEFGFQPIKHVLQIYGLCSKCQTNTNGNE
mgnify:CR=1 FL=1